MQQVVEIISEQHSTHTEVRMLSTDSFDQQPKPILFNGCDTVLVIVNPQGIHPIKQQIMSAVTGFPFVEIQTDSYNKKWIREDYLEYLHAKEQS
jgi:hypothetical protein